MRVLQIYPWVVMRENQNLYLCIVTKDMYILLIGNEAIITLEHWSSIKVYIGIMPT